MPPPPTSRTGSSLPSSSSSPAPPPSAPAQPIAAATAFDRAKAFRERLESTRANTAWRASTVQQPPPPPPPLPGSVPSTREARTSGTHEEIERSGGTDVDGGQGKQSAQPELVVDHLSSHPEATLPPLPYIPSVPSSAYPISSGHPQAQSSMLAPLGTSVEAMIEHALGVVGVSREEWEDTHRVEEALCRIWEEKILPLPPSQLPCPVTSSTFYLLSTLLTPSSPSSPARLSSSPLLRMAAYLTMVEKAREGAGGGEWGRVYESLAEGWRVELV
ncbi:hypothetical protein JCM10296v2_006872 [Rhodotorula toruloides]